MYIYRINITRSRCSGQSELEELEWTEQAKPHNFSQGRKSDNQIYLYENKTDKKKIEINRRCINHFNNKNTHTNQKVFQNSRTLLNN